MKSRHTMGIYKTCDFCGKTGKNYFDCDCHAKAMTNNLQKMKTCIIKNVFQYLPRPYMEKCIYYKLKSTDGSTIYMLMRTEWEGRNIEVFEVSKERYERKFEKNKEREKEQTDGIRETIEKENDD